MLQLINDDAKSKLFVCMYVIKAANIQTLNPEPRKRVSISDVVTTCNSQVKN